MNPSSVLPRWVNLVGFQCVWLLTVAGAAHGLPWLGVVAALAFTTLTLAYGGQARADLGLLIVALPYGFALDTLWVWLGLMQFVQPWPSPSFAPVWIMALWLGFSMTINHSLAPLKRHLLLAALLGAIAGPLAYVGAARGFSAVVLAEPLTGVIVGLSLAWAITVPAMLAWGRQLELPRLRRSPA